MLLPACERFLGGGRFSSRLVLGGTRQKFQTKERIKNYDEYLWHQKSKLATIPPEVLQKYDKRYGRALGERLDRDELKSGTSVLCLAARQGTEVRAFIARGCFAAGIDLNPGAENHYVMHGDFHNLQFADHSIDAVFTNSLDHVFDITKVISEVRRVLKPNGLFICETVLGEKEGFVPDHYASLVWKRVDDFLKTWEAAGFHVVRSEDFGFPDLGKHIVMQLNV